MHYFQEVFNIGGHVGILSQNLPKMKDWDVFW